MSGQATAGGRGGTAAAELLAIRETREGLAVLMLLRPASAASLGGYLVFPLTLLGPGESAAGAAARLQGSLLPPGTAPAEPVDLLPLGAWPAPLYHPVRGRVASFLMRLPVAAPGRLSPRPAEGDPCWLEPAEALRAWRRGRLRIASPAVEILQALRTHGLEPSRLASCLPGDAGAGILTVHEGIALVPVRTPTLPPAIHTNAYLLGREEFLVVDPASPYREEQERLAAIVESRLEQGHRCVALVLTHHHPDHVGGVAALQKHVPVPLWAHGETAARLPALLEVDRFLDDGDRLRLVDPAAGSPRDLDVLHTPGHAPGHLCLLDRRTRALVVGDMVASVGTILVDPEDGHMGQYLVSLRRLRELGSTTLLQSHGGPVADPDGHLEHYISHRLLREGKVVEALRLRPGGATMVEILPEVYDDAPEAIYHLALRSLGSHLKKLLQEGRVVERPGDRYALAAAGAGRGAGSP